MFRLSAALALALSLVPALAEAQGPPPMRRSPPIGPRPYTPPPPRFGSYMPPTYRYSRPPFVPPVVGTRPPSGRDSIYRSPFERPPGAQPGKPSRPAM